MSDVKSESIVSLRKKIAESKASKRRLSDSVKREVVAVFLDSKRKSGMFCQEIGISAASLSQWKKRFQPKKQSSFRKLEIVENPREGNKITIKGPKGLVIEDMCFSDVIEVWKRLEG